MSTEIVPFFRLNVFDRHYRLEKKTVLSKMLMPRNTFFYQGTNLVMPPYLYLPTKNIPFQMLILISRVDQLQ